MLTDVNFVDGQERGRRGLLRRYHSDGSQNRALSKEFMDPSSIAVIGGLAVDAEGAAFFVVQSPIGDNESWVRLHKMDKSGSLVNDALFPRLLKHETSGCYCHGREVVLFGTIAYVGGRCDCAAALWRVDLSGVDANIENLSGPSYVARILLGPPSALMAVMDDNLPSEFMVRKVRTTDLAYLAHGNWDGPDLNGGTWTTLGSSCGAWHALQGLAWVGGSLYRPQLNPFGGDIAVFAVSPTLPSGSTLSPLFVQDSGYADTLADLAVDSKGNAYLAAQYEIIEGAPTMWLKKLRPDGTEVTSGWNLTFPGEFPKKVVVDSSDDIYFLSFRSTSVTNSVRLRKYTAAGTLCWDNLIEAGPHVSVGYQGLAVAP